jgi:protein TonB
LVISAGVHMTLAGLIAVSMSLGGHAPEKIDIQVLEFPKEAPPDFNIASDPLKKIKPESRAPEPARKVFGVARNSLVSDEAGPGVEVKQGNTLATAPDNEKLKDGDAGSLPIPTDEYLVSKMPRLEAEVRIPYPPEAKARNIEGPVVLEILIDAAGRVRDAKLISGPGAGLNEAALAAIKLFKFSPAEVDGKAVTVRTRFTYRFVLEKS